MNSGLKTMLVVGLLLAAGPLAPDESQAQVVRLDIADLRVTIRVERANEKGDDP